MQSKFSENDWKKKFWAENDLLCTAEDGKCKELADWGDCDVWCCSKNGQMNLKWKSWEIDVRGVRRGSIDLYVLHKG